MKKSFSLKDSLFNKGKVTYLANLFSTQDKTFKNKAFVEDVMATMSTLELKERIVWIAEVLENYLPKDFDTACALIVKSLPEPLDPNKTDNDYGSFIFAPLGEYVVRNGLKKKHLNTSFNTLYQLTQRFSMEDAMRSFINEYEDETLAMYNTWVTDANYHVRRLVSESTRPLLPWSKRVGLTVSHPIAFLDKLYADNARFVTRSVANHLNDISKKDPSLAVDTLTRWKKEGKQEAIEMEWIIRHALRTLIKQGNKDALLLLGYDSNPKITVEKFSLEKFSKKISPGEVLSFSFTICAEQDTNLMIDYIIDFVKAKGHTTPKVFKIKKVCMQKDETIFVTKNHLFVSDATTFTLYKGVHKLTLQINGKKFYSTNFNIH